MMSQDEEIKKTCVTCNLSITPTGTGHHPGNSTTLHSRLVCEDPKTQQYEKLKKSIKFLVFKY